MSPARILRVYLDAPSRARAEAGTFNIMSKIKAAFEGCGYRVAFAPDTEAERAKSAARRGYALFHMAEPFHARALNLRRAYFYPFWRIENSAKRWEWDIARAVFDPANVPRKDADQFFRNWQKRLFPGGTGAKRQGFVYVPLQGRLLDRRSFQSQSPLDMIRSTLAHEPARDVVLGLHPKETYLPEELDALRALADGNRRLRISTQPMEALLQGCDYVVTQNSSVALTGFFLERPAVLFAQIDFHHIAANVPDLGTEAAFAQVMQQRPDYAGYLHWFLKRTAINGGSDAAEAQILDAVRRHGWEV